MFEKLDHVNWASFGAPQIPDLLRTIHDTEERSQENIEAWQALREFISPLGIEDQWDWDGPRRMMQNDLPHQVVPFLIEMLENSESWSQKTGIIKLLDKLCSYHYVRLWISTDETNLDLIAFDGWTRRLVNEVQKGIPLYESLLQDENEYVRSRVKELFDTLEEASE